MSWRHDTAATSPAARAWRVLLDDGTFRTVYVTAGPEGGFVASFGDEDEGADAWEGAPREAVTGVCAGMHWAVRQILSPDDQAPADTWRAGAEAMREAVALQLEHQADALEASARGESDAGMAAGLRVVATHQREQAVLVRAMPLPAAPS
jgi:hypothetical protein